MPNRKRHVHGWKVLGWTVISVAILVDVGCASRIGQTPVAGKLTHFGGVVPQGYKSYSLFVNASQTYSTGAGQELLSELEARFDSFGKSIGRDNLAVWVDEPGSEALSVSKGKYYIDLVSNWSGSSIEYSDGPFVLIASCHPGILERSVDVEDSEHCKVIVFSFRGVTPRRVIDVLNFAEARIRREQLNRLRANVELLWVKLQSWWDSEEWREFTRDVTVALVSK